MHSYLVAVFLISALPSAYLVGKVREWALTRALLDVPNERSLHVVPTPRGGGVAILLVVSIAQALAILMGKLTFTTGMPWLLATVAYGVLGAWDDHKSLSSGFRLLFQFGLAASYLGLLVITNHWPLSLLGAVAAIVAVFAVVWSVNLYNFMDGTDGIAGIQALAAAAGGACLSANLNLPGIAFVSSSVAGASLGFLMWNWQPAKIFLGDVGSYFLGSQFALLAINTMLAGFEPWFWLILLAPFIVDASLTLLRRIVCGEPWRSAHRSHAYQLLVRQGWTHRAVAASLLGIVAMGLGPLAWSVVKYPEFGLSVTGLSFSLMTALWLAIVARARALL